MVSVSVSVSPVLTCRGRELQRYNNYGGRIVVGCIPYRFVNLLDESNCGSVEQTLQVLVISSQTGHSILFPKGGWDIDETLTQAAKRESFEEAGVDGIIEESLGTWTYKSRRYGSIYEGYMLPMNVTKEFRKWPEKKVGRQRKWVSVKEAREGCRHGWMKEALEILVTRLGKKSNNCN